MTAPPPASPPPKMSQPTDQERELALLLCDKFVIGDARFIGKAAAAFAEALAAARGDAYAEGAAEGAAEQRKRDADVAARIERYDVRTALYKHKQSIAAAIEKETTNE